MAQATAEQVAEEEEEELRCRDGVSEKCAPTDWRYVIKFTEKLRFARVHKRDGCHFARDARAGVYMVDIDDRPFDAYCKKCFRRSEAPLQIAESTEQDQEKGEQSSDTASESSSTDFAESHGGA